VRGQRLPAPGEPVRDDRGHEPRVQLDGAAQGTGAPRADVRLDELDAVAVAQLVLRRLPVGQLPGIRARVPVQQQDAVGVQHDRLVAAGHRQPGRGRVVRRARPDRHAVRAGPVLRVHVPHDPRHNGQVGAAARARPARRVRRQRHTAGHHAHAGRVRRAVRQRHGLADRVLRERRRRAGVDGPLAAAGRRVAVRTPFHRPGREGLHTTVARQHRRPRKESN